MSLKINSIGAFFSALRKLIRDFVPRVMPQLIFTS